MVQLDRWADAVAGWRKANIDTARCLPRISPRSDCSACAAVCPEGAITLGRSSVVAECTGCGLCAAACRADAIVLDSPSDDQLVQRFATVGRTQTHLTLTCMDGPAGPERVGCLGRLAPELLLAAAACGFAEVELVAGPCAQCRSSAARISVDEAATTAQAILDTLNRSCQIRLIDARAWQPEPGKQAGTGSQVQAPVYEERRAFLLSAFGLLRELLPLGHSKAPTAPHMSRRREILRWALSQLQVDERCSTPWGEAGVRLTGRCLHCGICQRLCPNGAIHLTGDAGLQLDPGRCHTCGLCIQVCPVTALSLGSPYSLGEVAVGGKIALGETTTYHCTACGEPVTATGEGEPHCLPCTLRPQHSEVFLL